MSLPVGVLGALGRMGRTVCDAVDADPELELVCGVDPAFDGSGPLPGFPLSSSREVLADSGAAVAVDFTRPDQIMSNVRWCVEHAIHCVVGTTGLGETELRELERLVSDGSANVFVAPNFSIGAVLMMRFAEQAARYFGSAEVVELHHNQKLDAPSGTARATAEKVARAWKEHGRQPGGEPHPDEEETVPGARGADVDGVRVHAVRLHGLLAHQEVVLGGAGQLLTIRHDTLDRTSFMPGVLLAVKSVSSRPGLTVGLEHLLGL